MRHLQVLQKLWMVLERQFSCPLTPHTERPVCQTLLPHSRSCFTTEGVHNGYFLLNDMRIVMPFTVFDHIRQQRMQPVYRDKFFGKIERRAKMVDSAIDVFVAGECPEILPASIE